MSEVHLETLSTLVCLDLGTVNWINLISQTQARTSLTLPMAMYQVLSLAPPPALPPGEYRQVVSNTFSGAHKWALCNMPDQQAPALRGNHPPGLAKATLTIYVMLQLLHAPTRKTSRRLKPREFPKQRPWIQFQSADEPFCAMTAPNRTVSIPMVTQQSLARACPCCKEA